MDFLQNILGQAAGALGGGAGAPQGLAGSLVGMLTSGQGQGGGFGGLGGLVQAFEQNGLGNVIGSWIGNGQNLPIAPEQIQQVLGNEQLQQLAAQHGIDVQQLTSHLSTILPQLVDHMTPTGTLPPQS